MIFVVSEEFKYKYFMKKRVVTTEWKATSHAAPNLTGRREDRRWNWKFPFRYSFNAAHRRAVLLNISIVFFVENEKYFPRF